MMSRRGRALIAALTLGVVVITPASAFAKVGGGDPNAHVGRHRDYIIGNIGWDTDGQDGTPGTPGTTHIPLAACSPYCTTITFHNTCDDGTVPAAPCTGPPVQCPVGMERWNVHFLAASGVEAWDKFVCRLPGTPPIPDIPGEIAQMHAALELKNPQVKVHPDASVLPVTLDAYVETTKLAPYSVTKPQSGGQITINATDPHYLWDFGDGSATVITTSNGGPYPTGDVRHPYQHKNPYTIRLRTSWHVDATFTLDDLPEVGTIGPIDAPNNPQVTVASSTAAITIVEAHAVLVG